MPATSVGKGRKVTYEEWLDKKNAEELYWKVLVEAERREQEQLEAERRREEQKAAEER